VLRLLYGRLRTSAILPTRAVIGDIDLTPVLRALVDGGVVKVGVPRRRILKSPLSSALWPFRP